MPINKEYVPIDNQPTIKPRTVTGIFTRYIAKTLPLAFDESMSYYECLCALLEYINTKVIPALDNNAAGLLELQTFYDELQTYVNDYFKNLDVQEEINNKLDDMAESGQLTDIIAQYLGLSGMITFDTVQDMQEATNLVNGSKCKTLGYHTLNDNGGAFYKIRTITNDDVVDGSNIIEVYDNTLIAELIYQESMTPEQFGCYGDNVEDDTSKLQLAINTCIAKHINIVAEKIYKTSSSITISGNDVKADLTLSTINYSGNGSAIILTDLVNSNIKLGYVNALAGNGIEIKSTSNDDWNQYVNIDFVEIKALNYCIYFNRSGGWCNEIRLRDGMLSQGNYGIYTASNASTPAINNITIENVGIEGVTTGLYLCDHTESWNILNCRYHESFTTLIQTVGTVRRVNWIGTGPFYPSKCTFSSATRMKIISPIYAPGGSMLDHGALIWNGHLKTDNYRSYVNISANNSIDLVTNDFIDTTKCCPYYFFANPGTEIILNDVYGSWNGINEFIIYFSMSSGAEFTLKQNNTVLLNDTTGFNYKPLKFTWVDGRGWRYEIVTLNNLPAVA